MAFRLTKPCENCGGTGETQLWYANWGQLVDQTPREVWEEYRANGYTTRQAIREEYSYWN